MSGESGGADRNPGIFMMRDSSQALVPAEFPFTQRDEGFDGKALADHSGVGRREMNVFAAGLKAGHHPCLFEKGNAPAGKEAAISQNFLGQASEGGFEPTQSRGDEGGVGDVVLEGLDHMGHSFDNGHQDLGSELC